jgi:ABC-type transport system involved in multi-copper enzyme maturation permease subunit
MSSPSAPASADAVPPPPAPLPPGRPRRIAAGWPLWRERLIGLAFVATAIGLALYGDRLTGTPRAILWAAWLGTAVIVVSMGWLPLTGPVFRYDLVRTTRRGRYAVLRVVYAVALLLFILALYRVQPALRGAGPGALMTTGAMARFAETFTYTFLGVQFVAVIILTPAYVAGAVAEEKDRKTLEFLLATDIRDREVVLGKMASRVANLALFLLTGLPILSLTQLWGGVDFGVLLDAFLVTGTTLLSLAAVSMVTSVYCRKARDAVVLAYLVAIGFGGVTVLAALLNLLPGIAGRPLTSGTPPFTVKDVVDLIGCGNPGLLCLGIRDDLRASVTLPAALAVRARDYAVFHLLVTVVGTGWAVLRLRPLALSDGAVPVKARRIVGRWRLGWRPRLGRRALLWKEIWAEPGLTFNWFGKAILLLIVLASLLPALWLTAAFLLDNESMSSVVVWRGGRATTQVYNWDRFSEAINTWVRVVGTLVACLTLLGVAVRAASSISGERDRQTFDSLLTAPLDSNSILFAKWLGSVLSVRRAWLWLCLVWLLGTVTGGLYGPVVPWLLLAWLVYAGFLAVLGLWFSMTCATTLRATVWTLLAAAALGVGHWYLWLLLCMPLRLGENVLSWLVRFQMFGLTPPVALGWLAFRGDTIEGGIVGSTADDPMGSFACVIGGLVFWGAAGFVLYRRAARRFRVLTGRGPVPRPEAEGQVQAAPAKPRRVLRVAIGLAAGAALLVVGWGAFHSWKADRDLQAALDETDRTDPDWHFPDLEGARKPVPAERNSAPLVLAVHGLLPRWNLWPTQDLVPQLDDLPPQTRLSRQHWLGITSDLEDVEEVLPVLAPLADMPEGRYVVTWSRNPLGTMLPHLDAQYKVGLLLRFDLMLRADEGDPDGALADCRALLNLGRSLGDEPLMVSQNVRNNTARLAVRAAQRVLAQGEPSEAALAELQRCLANEDRHPGFQIGARSERAQTDGLMALIQADEFAWQDLGYFAFRGGGEEDMTGNLEALAYSLTPGADKESRAALLRHQTALIEAAGLSDEAQGPAFARLEVERKRLPLVARQLSWFGDRICERHRTGRAELRCAEAALAAERYRRRHNRWPERLEELTPDLLAKVPADPFGGAPLHYKRLADGVVIYSVGPNGQDDGGDVLATPGLERTGRDLGFRLWDVPARRQEPSRAAAMEPAGQPR